MAWTLPPQPKKSGDANAAPAALRRARCSWPPLLAGAGWTAAAAPGKPSVAGLRTGGGGIKAFKIVRFHATPIPIGVMFKFGKSSGFRECVTPPPPPSSRRRRPCLPVPDEHRPVTSNNIKQHHILSIGALICEIFHILYGEDVKEIFTQIFSCLTYTHQQPEKNIIRFG